MQIENFFPYTLAVVAEHFSRELIAVYGRKYGLSREEWRLLFLLADAGTGDSLSLAQRSSLDKVQVSRAAQRLEKKKLITREILSADRRLRSLTITDRGRALFKEAFAEVDARATEVLSVLDPADRQALQQGILALQTAVGRANDPA